MKKSFLIKICILSSFIFSNNDVITQEVKDVQGIVINHVSSKLGKYIGSPSICILPNGNYVASHDEFGPKSTEFQSAKTRIFISSDQGIKWKQIAIIDGQFWSNLFVLNGCLYIMGTNKHHGNVVIRRSIDNGKSWTIPYNNKNGLILEGEYGTAPVPIVEHKGRIWRAVEYATAKSNKWGVRYSAMMISAPLNSNILHSKNWRKTNILPYDSTYLDGKFSAWLEGNAVISPKNEVLNILRVAVPAGCEEFGAFVKISSNGKKATFKPSTGFVKLPGASKKFTIRYDKHSKLYWSIVNYVRPEMKNIIPSKVRNVLALCSSNDLKSWNVNKILLEHSDIEFHGFQYVDWQIEKEDIIFLSRTAFDDEEGGAINYHDANYLTFHRISDFRRLSQLTIEK